MLCPPLLVVGRLPGLLPRGAQQQGPPHDAGALFLQGLTQGGQHPGHRGPGAQGGGGQVQDQGLVDGVAVSRRSAYQAPGHQVPHRHEHDAERPHGAADTAVEQEGGGVGAHKHPQSQADHGQTGQEPRGGAGTGQGGPA